MNKKKSLNADYFKDVYDAQDDPWNFETSPYEAEKYQATIAALSIRIIKVGKLVAPLVS